MTAARPTAASAAGAAARDRSDTPADEIRADTSREGRTGLPEIVLADGKTPEQAADALDRLVDAGVTPALASRVDPACAAAITARLPDVTYDPRARIAVARNRAEPLAGTVALVCAGTSDLPVAAEAHATLAAFGVAVDPVHDVGAAGVQRVLAVREQLNAADVVVVVAGMEGALPTVVGGMVEPPLIAVPTSVGYGATFEGITPLLSMLATCAPGATVVNIDGGLAGALAAVRVLRALDRAATDVPAVRPGSAGGHPVRPDGTAREASVRGETAAGSDAPGSVGVRPVRHNGTEREASVGSATAARAAMGGDVPRPSRVAHVACDSGIAGDMVVAALVDAGAPLDRLQREIDALDLGTVRLRAETVPVSGVATTKMRIELPPATPRVETLADAHDRLARAPLTPRVAELATRCYDVLGAAEARVHGVAPGEGRLHELGNPDTIIDFVAAAAGLVALDAGPVTCGPVAVGSGTIETHHGPMPVPAPAVADLLRGFTVIEGSVPGEERATPTGAAILAATAEPVAAAPAMVLRATGRGTGDLRRPNPGVVTIRAGDPATRHGAA